MKKNTSHHATPSFFAPVQDVYSNHRLYENFGKIFPICFEAFERYNHSRAAFLSNEENLISLTYQAAFTLLNYKALPSRTNEELKHFYFQNNFYLERFIDELQAFLNENAQHFHPIIAFVSCIAIGNLKIAEEKLEDIKTLSLFDATFMEEITKTSKNAYDVFFQRIAAKQSSLTRVSLDLPIKFCDSPRI